MADGARKSSLLFWLLTIILSTSYTRLSTRSKFCYKTLCRCNNGAAVCSGYGSNLTYIPRLPKEITQVNFSYNLFENVTRHKLSNLTYLRLNALYIPGNKIVDISPDAFDDLKYLNILELSSNPISARVLQRVLPRVTKLMKLILNSIHLGNRLVSILSGLNNPQQTSLELNDNGITEYNQTLFKNFHLLQSIDLANNRINRVTIHKHSSIQAISLTSNSISTFPPFCAGKTNLNPLLTKLQLDINDIKIITRSHFKCLSSLQWLTLSSNPVKELVSNLFADLTSLQNLHLRYLIELAQIRANAFNNSHIKLLDLRDNQRIMKLVMDPNAFIGCTNLLHLSLSYSSFSSVDEKNISKLFEPLSNLQSLDMGSCGLHYIPKAISNLRNLTFLALHKNYISSWPTGTFDKLTKIKKLYLTANKITSIQEDSFPKELRENIVRINLALNLFSCNCDILWFLDWFRRDIRKFANAPKDYVCFSPVGLEHKRIIDVELSEQKCLLNFTVTIVIMFSVSLIIALVLVISLLYKYRWYIRYYVYMARYDKRREDMLWNEDFKYDAFVCYSAKDEDWVVDELMTYLEEHHNFKLCIHGRDFKSGLITDLIVDSIEESRKIILVLSNEFARSHWCQFELTITQSHVLETGQDKLVVVMLNTVPARHMSNTLHVLLKNNSYISWPQDACYRDIFWQRLHQSLIPPR